MSPGDIFITLFVAAIFFGGIFLGIRLFKWNMKDQKEKAERNEKIREKNKSK
tara:strand:+ start:2474 stop:2629 length:156 start_codon:yes stop_codon:yes gene_type:complete